MATLADGSNAYNPRREKLFHYLDKLKIIILFIPSIISIALSIDTEIIFWTMFAICMTFWATVMIFAPQYHDEGMCTICSRTELIVLNEAATKHRRALKSTHTYYNTTHKILNLTRISPASTTGRWIQHLFPIVVLISLIFIRLDIAGFNIPIGATIGVPCAFGLAYILKIHRKYWVWCPWCDHGRGDDDEPTPQPVPEPTGTEKVTI